jgi:hypothetical protein
MQGRPEPGHRFAGGDGSSGDPDGAPARRRATQAFPIAGPESSFLDAADYSPRDTRSCGPTLRSPASFSPRSRSCARSGRRRAGQSSADPPRRRALSPPLRLERWYRAASTSVSLSRTPLRFGTAFQARPASPAETASRRDGRPLSSAGRSPGRRARTGAHRLAVADLLEAIPGRNFLIDQEDMSRCHKYRGLQTDHNWQLKS